MFSLLLYKIKVKIRIQSFC